MLKFSNRHISRRAFLKNSSLALPFILFPQSLSAILLKEQFIHRTAFAMGTTVSIQAYHPERMLLQQALSKAFDELYRLDNLLSGYKNESDISAINRSAGTSDIHVHADVIEILQKTIQYSKETNGIFDCTIEPLMKLWGFRNTTVTKIPSDSEIQSTLDAVGYKNISVDEKENSVGLLNQYSSIDLGGIAVGYTVDKMAAILKSEGIESALINHSGDLFAIGAPPELDGWKIGIPSPTNQSEFIAELNLKNQSLSTSGSYEKFTEIEFQKFGHIVDSFSGKPATRNLSVSVISNMSITSDVLSTAIFCQEFAMLNLKKFQEQLEVLVVDHRNDIKHFHYNPTEQSSYLVES